MRENYDSFKFWDLLIRRNRTIRGHMFMNKPPTKSSVFIHTLIFSKKNGMHNVFSYFPDAKMLLGYIQHSFLQEAFYMWINGKDKVISKVPALTVEKIIHNGINENKIHISDAKLMFNYYDTLNKMWKLPKDRLVSELIKYTKDFNKKWYGNNEQFLYLKIMDSAEELGEFVINSALIVGDEESFKMKIGIDVNEWRMICKHAINNPAIGERFKTILQKNLTEII